MLHMIYIMYKQVPGKHRPLQQQQKHDAAAANMQPGPSTGITDASLAQHNHSDDPTTRPAGCPHQLAWTATHQSSTGGTITSWGDFSHAPPPPIWGLGGSSIGDGCPERGCCLFALALQGVWDSPLSHPLSNRAMLSGDLFPCGSRTPINPFE